MSGASSLTRRSAVGAKLMTTTRLLMSAALAQRVRRPGRSGPAEAGEQVDELLLDQAAVAGRVLGLDEQPHRPVGVGHQLQQPLQGEHPAVLAEVGRDAGEVGRVADQLVGRRRAGRRART